jgi:hypothetical protein
VDPERRPHVRRCGNLFVAEEAIVRTRLAWLVGVLVLSTAGGIAPVAARSPQAPPAPPDLTRLRDGAAARASSNNTDPASNDDSWRPIAGETVTLADLVGPGVVTHLWVTVAANEYGWPRLLRLRVYYDDSVVPSVDCPLGDFFAVGHGLERPVWSLMVRDGSSGRSRNSYWQMPFKRRVRVTLTNEGRRRVSNLYFHVDWTKVPSLPANTAYFHARYRQALPARAGRPYEILSVRGRGHYVGTVFSVVQNEAGWFGEGDERFYVDGAAAPSIEGTGTEDYFNDAWSFRVSDGLYSGVPVADGTGVGARMTAYRWHVPDPVPFATALRLDIEHAGWTYDAKGAVRSAFEERADLFSSVAFWYQEGIATDQPPVPYGAARLPLGHAQQIEAEAAIDAVTAEGGAVSVQTDVFWSKDLLFFEARAVGAKVTVPFDVDADGRYEIVAELAHSPDYGIYAVELDGQPAGASTALEHEPGANVGDSSRVDAYFTETYVGEQHVIGWATLERGKHRLTFVCAGRNAAATAYNVGIDTIVLARAPDVQAAPGASSARADGLRLAGERRDPGAAALAIDALRDPAADVRGAAAWTLAQVGGATPGSIGALSRALGDEDHVVRGLAALALREAGAAAAPARPDLLARLGDDEVGVRMMAAQALGRQRDPGNVAPLLEACRVPGQHVHVLRSLADALGEIGPAASRALPVLEELARLPRVEWAAKAAMRRISAR